MRWIFSIKIIFYISGVCFSQKIGYITNPNQDFCLKIIDGVIDTSNIAFSFKDFNDYYHIANEEKIQELGLAVYEPNCLTILSSRDNEVENYIYILAHDKMIELGLLYSSTAIKIPIVVNESLIPDFYDRKSRLKKINLKNISHFKVLTPLASFSKYGNQVPFGLVEVWVINNNLRNQN